MNQAIRKHRHRRIRSIMNGTASRPRACVFRSTTRVSVQVIDDAKGVTLFSVYGKAAKKQTKVEQAVAVGKEVAALAKKAGIEKIVFDRGGYAYQGRVAALAESMREGGLAF